jgi:fibronectin-binding autotransporter adhesin
MNTTIRLGVLALVPAALLASASIASASIIASESFESYSPGAIAGQNGGTGWAAAWTETAAGNPSKNVVDTTSSPLVFVIPGGQTIDGATRAVEFQMPGTSTAGLLQRQLSSPLSQTYYVAYLVRYVGSAGGTWAGGNNTFTLHLGTDATTTSTTLNFGLRGDTGGGGTANEFVMRVGTGAPVAGASTGGQLTNDTTYYLVCQYNWGGSGFTSAKMWLNPTLSDITDTPGGDASLTFASPIAATAYVFYRATVWENNDIVQVDELKIGTDWVDVVPPLGPPVPQVSVETKADGTGVVVPAQTITAGNSITNYAIVRDGSGNFLSNTVASWSAVNGTGGIGGGDIVPVNGGKSAVFTGHRVGTANLRATPPTGATVYNDSGLITVQAAGASQVRVETAPDGGGTVVPAQSVASGGSLTVFSISRDAYGNYLGNISATWSLQNKTSGVANGDLSPTSGTSSTFTGNLSGTANIRATSGVLTSVDSGLITVSRAVTWVGGGANLWDFSTPNWTIGSPVAFLDSDDVTFDGSGSMSPPVNITTLVKPHSMSVTAGPYTFGGGGGIGGVCAVNNSSGARLTFLTTNTYSGPTVVALSSELQLGNGVQNGSLGSGSVSVQTGGTSPIFNRTDSVSAPYVASNVISGTIDFTMDFLSGATELKGNGANNKAKAIVRSGATLILSCAGTDLGANTVLGGFGATNLIVETGGTCKLGVPNTAGDHLTAAGRYVYVDGIFDANGSSEAFGVLVGSGVLDNTGVSNAVFTIMQASSDTPNGGIGNGGEIYTWPGQIRNTGAGKLGITKDGTNTLILVNANTYGGDTRVIAGGILELGNANSMQNSTLDSQAADTGKLSFGSLTSANLGGLKNAKGFGLTNSSGAAVALTIGGNGQNNTFSGALSDSGSLTKAGAGAQTLSGTNTYAGSTTVSLGTLLVNGGLSGSGTVTVGGGGTLGGTGFINGAVGVSGTLRPGNNAIGKLTVNSTVTLSGTTVMEINRTTGTNDQLAATGISLGGTLVVTNLGGTLQAGNTFTLFSGSLSGSGITPASLPPLWPGLSWNTASLNSAGTISVIGTRIPPTIGSVTVSGTNMVLSGSGGLAGATYYMVSTNNVTAPLANWPRITTNTFAADGKFTNSVPFSLATPQSYFSIQAP